MTDPISDFDDILDTHTFATKDVPLCLDLNLLNERDDAMANVDRVYRQQKADQRMAGATPELAAAKAAVDDVERRIRDRSFVLRITGVDRFQYNKFLLECPPRPGKQETFDPTKFYMHAARHGALYVDRGGNAHPISDKQWAKIDKALTDGEHDRVAQAVLDVNRTVGHADLDFLGDASETTTVSDATSASPATSDAPPASSGAGAPRKRSSRTSTTKAARSTE